MKIADMNARQKKAYKNVYHAARDYIGGLENGVSDNATSDPKTAQDYQAALDNRDGLIETIYNMAITDIYEDGACTFGERAKAQIRDIRFCGKDWIMERVERQVTKLGY